MRGILILIGVLYFSNVSIAQYIFKDSLSPDRISLTKYAQVANAGQKELNVRSVLTENSELVFKPLTNEYQNFGFTKDHFWVSFSLINNSGKQLTYYLETARPVTDHVDLYCVDQSGKITEQHTGDDMPYPARSFDHRKSIFPVILEQGHSYKILIHLKSDGEVIALPLFLRSSENLLHLTYLEQLVFGIFYGILLLAAIIYLFFFFGLKDKSFLYYSLYVVFIALMQFSLDGYFYEYVTPGGGWFSLHAVLIFATVAAFLLGKYAELFLNIPVYNKKLSNIFRIVYILIGILFLCLLFIPSFFPIAYPLANLCGLVVLALIIYSILFLSYKNLPVDKFFTTGILFLIAGFVLFILNNFNVIPITFLSQNSSKLGTGMEIIFISLSMANRIRRLREEREILIDDLIVSNHDLKQFTYITSHDLRAPISNLTGLVSLYDKNADTSARNKMVIDKIQESTRRLNETVSDLINILLIKNNTEIERATLKFKDTLEGVLASIETAVHESGATIHANFSGAESINFNKNYLESIFLNLLTNAIRYRSAARPLVVDIKTTIKDHAVYLTFADNGSGINLERHKEKVFGMHQRFHSNTESKGVGLYIIKSQINSLGGTIEIDSKENIGTTFMITFKQNRE